MDQLQQFFRDAVVDQLRVLEALAPTAKSQDAAAIRRVRTIAHNLKGSGTTYGFPEVSEAAARLEALPDDAVGEGIADFGLILGSVTSASTRTLVLVVDDDPLITRLLEARLTTPGRRVTSTDSLGSAREMLREARPDLVILDLFLPDGDGRTLLDEIRCDPEISGVPVLVISGATDPAVMDEVTALGATDFISKPFLGDDVAARVTAALRGTCPEVGRGALATSYRALLERGDPISVIAVIPETHGPGGTRAEGPDPEVIDEVHSSLLELLGSDADTAVWGVGELASVSAQAPDDLIRLVDRARLRLRTLRHPRTENAVLSFSAGIVCDDGRGLTEAYRRAHEVALAANREGGDRVTTGEAGRRTGRVLLAEDDTLTAALVIHRLEREQFEVVHEIDGHAALQAVESGAFAIIVLDVQMPGLSGFDVLEKLRSQKHLDETPIVMLTAAGSEREVVRGFDLGANDYIVKPFSPAELTARLKRFVRP